MSLQKSVNNSKMFSRKYVFTATVLIVWSACLLSGAQAVVEASEPPAEYIQQRTESLQLFERSPTRNVTEEIRFVVHLEIRLFESDQGVWALFKEGFVFADIDSEQFAKSMFQRPKVLPASAGDVYTVEARDLQGNALNKVEVNFFDPEKRHDSRFLPGDFQVLEGPSSGFGMRIAYTSIELPIGTNSVALLDSGNQLLDRIYVENTEPTIAMEAFPAAVGASDEIRIRAETSREPMPSIYGFLVNAAHPETKYPILLSLKASGFSGELDQKISLAGFNLKHGDKWYIRIFANTLFKTAEIRSSTLTIEDQSLPVRIGGGDISRRMSGDEAQLAWDHVFYFLDVDSQLDTLCKKHNRCFELIWSGENVEFVSHSKTSSRLKTTSRVYSNVAFEAAVAKPYACK